MIGSYRNILLLVSFQLLLVLSAVPQPTKVSGKVTDSATGEPIPFVNIIFKNTTIGATSDLNGLYSLVTTQPVDSVFASEV